MKAGGVFSCVGVACFVGLPIGGALIYHRTSRGGNQAYLTAQGFSRVCLLLGGCLLLASRAVESGWAATKV